MINIIKFLNESSLEDLVLCESLESKTLQVLAKQMKNSGRGYWNNKHTLKDVMPNIRWDKITDSFCKECPKGDSKILKLMRPILNYNSNNVVLFWDETKSEFCFILCNGSMRQISPLTGKYSLEHNMRQYEIKTIINSFDMVLLDFDSDDANSYLISDNDPDSPMQRSNVRDGSLERRHTKAYGRIVHDNEAWGGFQGTGLFVKKIAEINQDRYKKMIADKRAREFDDHGIIDRVTKLVERVTSLFTTQSKASSENLFKIQKAFELLYSKLCWDDYDKKYKKDGGLLQLLNNFIKNKGSLEKYSKITNDPNDMTNWYLQNTNNMLEALEKMCDDIETLIEGL